MLDRLPMGVLLIGIDRAEAQNRIDIPTFSALGHAYYEVAMPAQSTPTLNRGA